MIVGCRLAAAAAAAAVSCARHSDREKLENGLWASTVARRFFATAHFLSLLRTRNRATPSTTHNDDDDNNNGERREATGADQCSQLASQQPPDEQASNINKQPAQK